MEKSGSRSGIFWRTRPACAPISSSKWSSRARTKRIRRATEEVPLAAPGERFVYSDINFFLLGDIVRRVSGERLDAYARTHVFDPLGMKDTMFLPPESRARANRADRTLPGSGVAVRRS